MSVPDVEIHVVNYHVEAHPDGGNRQVRPGEVIQWVMPHGADRFRLHFVKKDASAPGPDWPFAQADLPRGSNRSGWHRQRFTARVAVPEGEFKYSIETDTDTIPLDPMIIVR
jgi:hypothetical protein